MNGLALPPSTYLAQAVAAAFVTGLLILMLRRPAERWGLVDHPGGRKRHESVVPLTGGLGMLVGFLAALLVSFPAFGQFSSFFAGAALLVVIGLLDDLGEVSATSKMLVQVLAAVFMTSWGGNYLISLGALFGDDAVMLRNWAIPVTVFATIAIINSVNMFDGLDGLAGSLVFVILVFFAGFAWTIGDVNGAKIVAVLAGALGGFLLFNLPWRLRGRHRTFMGDSGSLVLGFSLAWFAVSLTQRQVAVPPPVMLWVLGIVLMDVFTVTVRRLARRRSPMAPDRDHLHHVLLRRKYSAQQALALLVGVNVLFAAVGTALWRFGASDAFIFWSFLAVCVVYFGLFFMPFRLYRLRSRSASDDDYERND